MYIAISSALDAVQPFNSKFIRTVKRRGLLCRYAVCYIQNITLLTDLILIWKMKNPSLLCVWAISIINITKMLPDFSSTALVFC